MSFRPRRLILGGLILLLLWCSSAPVSAHGATPLPPNVNLVGIGDSITAGWGSPQIQGSRLNGYLSQLHRQLLTRGQAELHNLGVPGLTSGQFLFLLDHWPEASHFVKQANVLTLSIGGNDIIWTDHQAPGDPIKMQETLSKYEANIDTILSKIREWNPSAWVFVLEVYNPFPVDDARHKALNPWILAFNEAIAHSAVYHGADVIPTATLFLGHERECVNLANNDIHPNIAGHTLIAEQISRLLFHSFVPLVVKPKMQPNLLVNGQPKPLANGLLLENDTVYMDAGQLEHLREGAIRNLWFRIGEWWARVNGKHVRLPSPILLKDGHPFLPLRAILESLGDKIYWVKDSQTMNVVTPESP